VKFQARGEIMQVPRRELLRLGAALAVLPVVSRTAFADDYPSRPVHVIVGFSAAGPSDIAARLVSQVLSERLGQSFIVEDRPGGGSNLATEMVVNGAPDGYTLLLIGSPNAVNATLYSDLKYNFIRDIAPVARVMRLTNVMVVNPSFPAKTVLEFIDYAKANPRKINMATAGSGSPPHMLGELFKMKTGVDLVTVAYHGGGPALVDLIAGQVQVMFEGITSCIEYIRAGKLRAIAVTAAERSQALPDVPSIGESVPGYDGSGWIGIGAPKGTPASIVDRLNKEINAGLAEPKYAARLAALGGVSAPMSPTGLATFIASETDKWAKVIKAGDLKSE
jgi:tripartite-type tricarboxylate transporter receptor subunit TctC